MSAQPYNTTMSWQQLIAAVQKDMAALYAAAGGAGTVTSVGLAAGSPDIVLGGTNPVIGSGTISVDLSSAVKTELAAAGTALQPVTGLGGSYTYASITLNAAGQIVAVGSGTAPPAAGNPTGTVGLAAVNGAATTFMRSDAAPPISQAIAPTWTATHTFSTATVSISAAGQINTSATVSAGTKPSSMVVGDMSVARSVSTGAIYFGSNGTQYWYYDGSYMNLGDSGIKTPGPIGVNGATPPAQVTGWGTPTGAAVVANFNGASGTLVNCSNAIAEIITILKAVGLIGA